MALLEIRNLEKTFLSPDGQPGARIFVPELDVEAGEAIALEGPSGSGKTTLLHMISGLLAPDAGSVRFDGTELTEMGTKLRDRWRAANIGYVFQKLNLIDALTAEENVLLAARWNGGARGGARERARELLGRVGLSGRAASFPRQMSIGEQQRVAVVRAVLNRPRLVLADEPTASLDRRSAKTVLAVLRELCAASGAALIVSTHDEDVKREFSRRYDVRNGGSDE